MTTERRPLDGLHIALLTASASRLGGGVSTVVQAHAELIGMAGGRVSVVTLDDRHLAEDRATYGGVPVLAARVAGPAAVGFAPSLGRLLDDIDPDILHLHGIWMCPSRAGSAWARRTGKPYVVSPHGMLDPWITARGKWKKALARLGYERASWARAAALHALTEAEAADIRREAGRGANVVVIANAGPPPDREANGGRAPLVAYLGRIHPKKNLAGLIDGWNAARLPPGAQLAIAGWGDAADVDELQARLAHGPRSIRFLGPAYGADKRRLLREARFLALPSHSEGLPMTILEAWAAGTPAIMTAACHLPEGFAQGAALECGTDAPSIARTLESALAIDEPGWRSMSDAALSLAGGPFSAGAIARRWADLYRELLGR